MPDLFGCIPPRPGHRCPEVIAAVANAILPDALGWLGEDDSDADLVRENLVGALMDCHDWDGYQLAEWLRSRHLWSPDAMLVSLLDEAGHLAYRERGKLMERWVSEHGVKCRYAVGDVVAVTVDSRRHTGIVIQVDGKLARYTVRIAELGHVENGQGTYGIVVDAETVDTQEDAHVR